MEINKLIARYIVSHAAIRLIGSDIYHVIPCYTATINGEMRSHIVSTLPFCSNYKIDQINNYCGSFLWVISVNEFGDFAVFHRYTLRYFGCQSHFYEFCQCVFDNIR